MTRPYVQLSPEEIDALPWEPIEGMPCLYEKIISRDPETGSHTRLIKATPGFENKNQGSHDFWEETYVLEGICWQGDKPQPAGTYCCYPPGLKHGPFRAVDGYITLEHRYYLYEKLPESE
ncbi:MAG: cupin domain-containing protein [Anaerolineales bacterium]|nr:cupin domain-containing protein [Anaerolineales bacterium]